MDAAAIETEAARTRETITGQDFSQVGQPHIGAVLRDQLRDDLAGRRRSHFEHATLSVGNLKITAGSNYRASL